MIEFIGPLYKLLQHFRNHIFDWTLSTSEHTTPPTELSVIVGFSLYRLGSDHAENTSTAYQRTSSIMAYSLPRDVFTESLPSTGSMRHYIYIYIYRERERERERKVLTFLDRFTVLRFTATGVPQAARRIRILPMFGIKGSY
jgi:hypothetical protein